LLVQNALKKLLKFGKVANFVGYDALNDFFPTYTLFPNPECDNRTCRDWVKKMMSISSEKEDVVAIAALPAVQHEDGDNWGIEVVDDVEKEVTKQVDVLYGSGLQHKYDATKEKVSKNDFVKVDDESVDDLAAALSGL
jgi:ubiquitin-like modifier-activating enzyme 5